MDFSEPILSTKVLPLLLWYIALLTYLVRGWFAWDRCVIVRKLFQGVSVGAFGEDSDRIWLIALQIFWAGTGQFLYYNPSALPLAGPALMLLGVHVPWEAFYGILVPMNAIVCFSYHCANSGMPASVVAAQCLVQAAALMLIVSTRDKAEKEHYHQRLASERGRLESMRTRLWAEAQRAAFRGMLDSVFDASCICERDGSIVSSTPQLDAILLGVGRGDGGVVGKRLADFSGSEGEVSRVGAFLRDVSQSTTARRLHTSLRRRQGAVVDVTVSGIAMPGGEAGGRQLFIGLEVAPGGAALETEEVADLPALLEAVGAASAQDSQAENSSVADEGADVRGDAASLVSAPPILERAGNTTAAVDASRCASGECLPAGALVRVEGRAAPVRVESVALGQRLLCVDHLSGAVKFSEVVEAEARDDPSPELLEVELEDGTEVQMTADHPVYAGADRHICARDLRSGQHRLEVLKVASLLVKEVRRVPQETPFVKTVSLSVHQPRRHSIFVSRAGACSVWQQGVAVASASMASAEERVPMGVRLKNTFIDGFVEDEAIPKGRPRATSAPGRCRGERWEEESTRSPARRARRRPPSSRTSSRRSGSTLGSVPASSKSSEGDEVSFVLSKAVEDRRVRGWRTADLARLSDMMWARRSGLKSIGSMGHKEGLCYPCLMESWGNPDRPCIFGVACSRCHENHSSRQFKRARYFRPRVDRIAELPDHLVHLGYVR